jgi:ABC-type Fe3+/spermidine/putrescine transport system ATPase subunit
MTRWTVEGLEAGLDHFRLGPVDLDLAPGHVVAVLGPSGAGKTTFLRTLAGFVPVRGGRVLRDGSDITALAPEHRRVGYVPQGLGLFPHLTVLRNVSYPRDIYGLLDAKPRARELLDRLGLTALANRRPSQLSGGEQQRVALARALAAEPELVLWDEPWQALDVEARHELGRVIDELRAAADAPIVLVTHDPALAFSAADRFVVLREGQVRYSGEAVPLLQRPTDAFTARFVGYENIVARAALEATDGEEFGAWLRSHAGTEGVAFPRARVSLDGPGHGRWAGSVRSVRPTPEGLAIVARVGTLDIAGRAELADGDRVPPVGGPVRFDVDEKSLRPLGNVARTEVT